MLAPIPDPPSLQRGNVGAIFMTKNHVIGTRFKHIALEFVSTTKGIYSEKVLFITELSLYKKNCY